MKIVFRCPGVWGRGKGGCGLEDFIVVLRDFFLLRGWMFELWGKGRLSWEGWVGEWDVCISCSPSDSLFLSLFVPLCWLCTVGSRGGTDIG